MSNDIYPDSRYIDEICNLFDENIYSKIILKKHTSKTQSDLLFETIDEAECKFIIKFISNTNIEITIPIKNKNYLYTTNFNPIQRSQNLNIIYNYLKHHISIHRH